jgi:hypothetical protein
LHLKDSPLQSLTELEALLGRRRPYVSLVPPRRVAAHWYCGCRAVGTSLSELVLARTCGVHAAGQIVAELAARKPA